MSLIELIILLVVAGICGSIGQSLAGFSRGGWLTAIALGYIGALLGVWIARKLDLPKLLVVEVGGTDFPIVWSIIGSALFVAVISWFGRGSKRA